MRVVYPPPFSYWRAESVAEASAALRCEPGAIPLAGATDVISMRNSGALAPSLLVDLKRIDELQGIQRADGKLRLGSCVTIAELAGLEDAQAAALIDGARVFGAVQTRNRATLGGNICRSSPAGDTLPALLALGAEVLIASESDARRLPLDEFFLGPGENALTEGEVLVGVELPGAPGASAYERVTYRAWMDLAVIGVAVRIALDDDRCTDAAIALGGVAPTPLLVPAAATALISSALEHLDVEAATEAALEAANPIDDVRGSRDYRLRALRALVPRMIARARARHADRDAVRGTSDG